LELKLSGASDLAVWTYAAESNCVVITKDEDFFHLANQPGDEGRLIWVRAGNCRNTELIQLLDMLWPKIEDRLSRGERIIEVR
jgi:predicted nuclease of predicted toxin-antitoxin system